MWGGGGVWDVWGSVCGMCGEVCGEGVCVGREVCKVCVGEVCVGDVYVRGR